MADQSKIRIKEINRIEQNRKDGKGTYCRLVLTSDDDKEYSGFDNSFPNATNLKVGDEIQVLYTERENFNVLLSIQLMKEGSDMRVKETVKSSKSESKEKNSKYFTITGTIYYAHVKEKDIKGEYPSNAYKLSLSVDKSHKDKLENLGVQVRNKDNEMGDFVNMKSQYQPKVLSPEGEDLTGKVLISNGSTATITTSLYDNTPANIKAGKGGKKLLGLGMIKLINFIEFEGKVQPLIEEDNN